MLLGQAVKNWMVTEEECGVHRCFLFYVKKEAFRVCMLLEMSQQRTCLFSLVLFAFATLESLLIVRHYL